MSKKSLKPKFKSLFKTPLEPEILRVQKPRPPNPKQMFRDARRTLEERRDRGPREPMINWDESKVEYVKRTRHARRQALLDEHVPERRCPICGETKLRSRQWVVLDERMTAVIERCTGTKATCVCKGCKMRYVK